MAPSTLPATLAEPAGLDLLARLAAHDVEDRRSRVRPVSLPIHPLARLVRSEHRVEPETLGVERYQALRTLLEAAYGFQQRPDHPRGFTRRAPSAGALYPIEVLVLTEVAGQPRVLYYDFLCPGLYCVPEADGRGLAAQLGLERGAAAFLLTAVFWRTVQRYGARGYRYCLLDAAHVAANLGALLAATGSGAMSAARLVPGAATLERCLALRPDEGLLCAVATRGPLRRVPAAPAPWTPPPSAHIQAKEEVPPLNPSLQRVVTFHRQALDRQVRFCGWPVPTEAMDAAWAGRRLAARRSAKDFAAAALPAEVDEALTASCRGFTPLVQREGAQLTFHAVRLRVADRPAGTQALTPPGPARTADGEDLAARLRAVCQSQDLVRNCSLALVAGIERHRLTGAGHDLFRDAALNAGFWGAEMYAAAARLGVGTTTIGGFSDRALAALLEEEGLFPITVQIFGPARDAHKVDADSVLHFPGRPGAL